MRVRSFGLAGLAAVLMMAAPGRSDAQTGQAWLHVRVDEPSKQGKVTVNLPVSVVSAASRPRPRSGSPTATSGWAISVTASATSP
jgi:hypothetical protein